MCAATWCRWVDLRVKFGMPTAETTVNKRIIVMDLTLDGDKVVLGAIADSVHEVMELSADRIEPPPKIGNRWQTSFIKGIGKRDDQFVMILDVDRVFSSEELSIVDESIMAVPEPGIKKCADASIAA